MTRENAVIVLLNPYLVGAARSAPRPATTARAAAAACIGMAVITGCSSQARPAAPPPPTSGPPPPVTAPAPSPPPAATPSPLPPAVPKPSAGPAANHAVHLRKAGADYRVVRGDTLGGIARRFGIKGGAAALFRRNSDVLWNPDLILVGQQLDLDGRV